MPRATFYILICNDRCSQGECPHPFKWALEALCTRNVDLFFHRPQLEELCHHNRGCECVGTSLKSFFFVRLEGQLMVSEVISFRGVSSRKLRCHVGLFQFLTPLAVSPSLLTVWCFLSEFPALFPCVHSQIFTQTQCLL